LLEWEFVIDDLTFELLPGDGHVAPLAAHSRKPVYWDISTFTFYNRKMSTVASEARLGRLVD
jgi:hypothetical protein